MDGDQKRVQLGEAREDLIKKLTLLNLIEEAYTREVGEDKSTAMLNALAAARTRARSEASTSLKEYETSEQLAHVGESTP